MPINPTAPTMNFHPPGAPVPEEKRTARIVVRPLRASDAEIDYEAVMSSKEQLRRWSQSDWPADDFSLAANRADLERHEREHRQRVAFTFTVLDPSAGRCVGCVYIRPLESWMAPLGGGARHRATVGFWVRAAERATDLDRHLLIALREWFEAEWDFDRLLFPVSPRDDRQVALLSDAGFALLAEHALDDGRPVLLFG